MMSNEKYKSLLERAKELREAAIVNATKQVLEETADEHRKLIYDKLNRNASKKLNENIYEDDEASALDKLLAGDNATPDPSTAMPGMPGELAPDAAAPAPAPALDAAAPPAADATGLDPAAPAAADATNDVNVDAMDITGDGGMDAEADPEEERINPKDLAELTDEDLQDLDEEKLRDLLKAWRSAYENEEITIPESEDGDVSLEIPETGEETPQGEEPAGGLTGDENGELDSLLASGGEAEQDTETQSELDGILSGNTEEDEDEQGLGLSLESRLMKRQKQLKETLRNKRKIMNENSDEKILLQDEDELEEADNSIKEEISIMDSKLTNLKDKLRNEIAREKRALTGERSGKTLNESQKRKLQRNPSKEEKVSDSKTLQEQIEILRHERDIYSRRLKAARQTLQERDEKLGKIENELEDVTNYTLRYSTIQKLFTNNPIVRQMNEAQKEEVIDIIDSVKGMSKDEAKKRLEEIYREFQEETSILSEGKKPTRKSEPLNESRKRPMARRGDVKPVLDSRGNKKEEQNLFESVEIKRMRELADISNDESDD